MKIWSKIVFIAYLLLLTWIVLFKIHPNIMDFIRLTNERSVNLIPYGASGGRREILLNVLIFLPFGILFKVVDKRSSNLTKGFVIFLVSCAFEILQYLLAIGATDITDVINNTIGGLIGLLIYWLLTKIFDENKLDNTITIAGFVGIFAFLAWQFPHFLHQHRRLRMK